MDTLKFTFKLMLTFIATSVVSSITMMVCLSADIEVVIKMIIGILFGIFILYMAFSSGKAKGEDDTKNNTFYASKGFVSAFLAMLPAIILAGAYMMITFNGWMSEKRVFADGLYMILYLMFLSYTPMLASFVTFNPAFSVDFAQPAITVLKNITTPNAVYAPMYLIPIVLFVLVVGFGYILGHKERIKLVDVVKKIKNKD